MEIMNTPMHHRTQEDIRLVGDKLVVVDMITPTLRLLEYNGKMFCEHPLTWNPDENAAIDVVYAAQHSNHYQITLRVGAERYRHIKIPTNYEKGSDITDNHLDIDGYLLARIDLGNSGYITITTDSVVYGNDSKEWEMLPTSDFYHPMITDTGFTIRDGAFVKHYRIMGPVASGSDSNGTVGVDYALSAPMLEYSARVKEHTTYFAYMGKMVCLCGEDPTRNYNALVVNSSDGSQQYIEVGDMLFYDYDVVDDTVSYLYKVMDTDQFALLSVQCPNISEQS